jgi:hypothetical protein
MFSQLTSSGASQPDADRAAKTRALKDMVRSSFGLAPDDSVFVAEVACGETDCPDVETVIAVFLGGARREFKIPKPVDKITAQDLTTSRPAAVETDHSHCS